MSLICAGQRSGEAGDDIARQLSDGHPFRLVQLVGCEVDALLVVTEVSAVEDTEKLVALVVTRRPVQNQQTLDLALNAKFLFQLAPTGTSRRLASVYVPAGNIPPVALGLVNQEDALAVDEQSPGRHAGVGEVSHWIAYLSHCTAGQVRRRRPARPASCRLGLLRCCRIQVSTS